ncbi:hypothetical protein HDK77DRAFT_293232 [Phyllosticta capitalensis]|uniref:Uncharacterized protein n=1 Tax=Phyllosticta capitalensis TaxID=121624 RepID=A0ABR1YF48_9PEZI
MAVQSAVLSFRDGHLRQTPSLSMLFCAYHLFIPPLSCLFYLLYYHHHHHPRRVCSFFVLIFFWYGPHGVWRWERRRLR